MDKIFAMRALGHGVTSPTTSSNKWLLLLLLLVLMVESIYSNSPPFIENDLKGLIAAFGDFDGDKMTDIFVIRDDSFAIVEGVKDKPLLRARDDWICKLPKDSSEKIVALMTADFHGDAKLDVLVVAKHPSQATHSIYLVSGRGSNGLNCKGLEKAIFNTSSQPLVFDFNGDMIADIFALSTENVRTVWTFFQNATQIVPHQEFVTEKPLFRKDSYSHAFVDLNHDMIPDVFIDGDDTMEYWTLGPHGYSKSDIIKVIRPSATVIGQSSFVDYNSDGQVDHLLPVCYDVYCSDSAILVYNVTTWIKIASAFRSPDNSTEAKFAPPTKVDSLQIDLPLTMRFADFNGDGFPDIVTIMVVNYKTTVALLLNQPSPNTPGDRTFTVAKTYEFESRTPVVASLFDLQEDGKPDIVVTTKDASNKLFIDVKENELMFDSCFIKVMVASGLDSESKRGTNQPGPHVCYEMIDTDGSLRRGCQGQLTQSTFLPLQMPYTIFGLGSTPNFVDKLSATIPSPNSTLIRTRDWPGIVPDAQILVIPSPVDSTSQWRMKLFLTPSDMVISTLITLASICIVLVVLIGILHRKEILEDIAEHEEYKRHVPR